MGAKVSAEMKHAVMLIENERKSVYEAARIAGVHASSVYKYLIRNGKKKLLRGIDKASA